MNQSQYISLNGSSSEDPKAYTVIDVPSFCKDHSIPIPDTTGRILLHVPKLDLVLDAGLSLNSSRGNITVFTHSIIFLGYPSVFQHRHMMLTLQRLSCVVLRTDVISYIKQPPRSVSSTINLVPEVSGTIHHLPSLE